MISLKPVERGDYKFMYMMLQERTPEQSISFSMPTWKQHVDFINSKPYHAWYIILLNSEKIGNIYLARDNSWGYFVLERYQCKGYGTQAMQEIVRKHPRKYYIANINPANDGAIHLARDRFKGELVSQVSYRIRGEDVLDWK
jgi:RimJ/RimL family protein N-acetyltransferase